MYINSSPILHIVDKATRFQATKFLLLESAIDTWNVIWEKWINIYISLPDIIYTDSGCNFILEKFHQNTTAIAITVKIAPVEAYNSISLVECYYTPLQRAYKVINKDMAGLLNKHQVLQMAVKAVNDMASPNSLVSMLLLFESYF